MRALVMGLVGFLPLAACQLATVPTSPVPPQPLLIRPAQPSVGYLALNQVCRDFIDSVRSAPNVSPRDSKWPESMGGVPVENYEKGLRQRRCPLPPAVTAQAN